MNKITLLLVLLLLLQSCSKTEGVYHITGHISNVKNVDTVSITFSSNGSLSERISCSVVENGEFYLEGCVENCKIAYLSCNTAGDSCSSMFFLEEGDLQIFIDSTHCRVTGTPINEENNIVRDSIVYYITQLENIENKYYYDNVDDECAVRLGIAGLCLQESLVNFLRKMIKKNINNLLGLYMLVTYNELFSIAEFSSLCKQLPPRSIDNNQFYDIIKRINNRQ